MKEASGCEEINASSCIEEATGSEHGCCDNDIAEAVSVRRFGTYCSVCRVSCK